MKFNDEEKKIIKNSIEDYDALKEEINDRIAEGQDIEDLYNYIRHLSCVDITNYELNDDYKYVDFNYYALTCTLLEDLSRNIETNLSNYVSIWNDKTNEVIVEIDNIYKLKEELCNQEQ